LAFALLLTLGAPAARAFTGGSVLFVEPGAGIRQWTPDAQTAPLVISGPPLDDPRGVAIDHAGNVIVADRFAGTLRYSPTGAFQSNIGIAAIDVTVAPSGTVYVVTDFGSVFVLSPPFQTQIATGISDPRGIASTRDPFGNDLIVVTSGAGGGELLRVSQQSGQTSVLATNLGDYIERPGVDRFGNVLVPRNGKVYVLDPNTGATRGSFASSTIDSPQGITSTSGDRYFLADGDAGGECRIVEIDPILGGAKLAAPTTMCTNSPWSIAAVPGGTASPKLATGDIVLTDTGAFGGAGGIFRVNTAGNVARPLRLGGTPVALDMVRVGPTRELITAGPSVEAVNRIDPGTGNATRIADAAQINGIVMGAAFERNGDLLLAVDDNPPGQDGRILRVVRAQENISANIAQVAALSASPKDLLLPYRAAPGSPFAGLAFMAAVPHGQVFPSWMTFDPIGGIATDLGQTADEIIEDNGAFTSDGSVLYFTRFEEPTVVRYDWTTGVRTLLSSHSFLTKVEGMDVDASGNILVADQGVGGPGSVIRVAPSNGQQVVVTKMGFVDLGAIAVVPPPACSDGVDNDGDGLVDYPADPGCLSPDDPWETVDCADGIDNDGDGNIDWDPNGISPDPSCSTAQFGMEQTQCSDGVDNDGDGKIDLDDPQCTSPTGNKESGSSCGLLGIEVVGVAGWAVGRKTRRTIARR
jgi:hypothetical protein